MILNYSGMSPATAITYAMLNQALVDYHRALGGIRHYEKKLSGVKNEIDAVPVNLRCGENLRFNEFLSEYGKLFTDEEKNAMEVKYGQDKTVSVMMRCEVNGILDRIRHKLEVKYNRTNAYLTHYVRMREETEEWSRSSSAELMYGTDVQRSIIETLEKLKKRDG